MASQKLLTIAHAFGNSFVRLSLALASPADIVEADVWFHRGRLVVRHEHQLGSLPILYDNKPSRLPVDGLGPWSLGLGQWYLRLALRPLTLAQIATRLDGSKGLLLDMKGSYQDNRPSCVAALARFLRDRRLLERAIVCGYDWPLLDTLRRLEPAATVYPSANTEARLGEVETLMATDGLQGVCIAHGLLDEERLRRFQEAGLRVFTWTVDGLERARQLRAWGVDGIISNDLALLAALGRS